MKSAFSCIFRSLLRCALVALPWSGAHAIVIGSYVTHGDGTVTYSYTVDNSSGAFDIAAWALEFPFLIPDWNQLDEFSGGDVKVPDHRWFADAAPPIGGNSAQDFLSLGPDSDVLVGSALSGFSFTSVLLPGDVTYYEFSAAGDSTSGLTVGPATAPTPLPEGAGPYEAIALAALAMLTASCRGRSSAV